MTSQTSLEILETPLGFDGAPDTSRRRERTVLVDDIANATARTAFGAGRWHPVCVVHLYGGEEITISLQGVDDRDDAHREADALARLYRHFVDVADDAKTRECAPSTSPTMTDQANEGSSS